MVGASDRPISRGAGKSPQHLSVPRGHAKEKTGQRPAKTRVAHEVAPSTRAALARTVAGTPHAERAHGQQLASCPHLQEGSDPVGGRHPACRAGTRSEVSKLMLIPSLARGFGGSSLWQEAKTRRFNSPILQVKAFSAPGANFKV